MNPMTTATAWIAHRRHRTHTVPSGVRRLLLLLLITIAVPATAQTADGENCSARMEQAERDYELGRYREAIARLSPCLDRSASDEDRWRAYRLVALSHLYLDERAAADSAIATMLAINPGYLTRIDRDPIELVRLLQGYGSYPRFAIGVNAGVAATVPEMSTSASLYGGAEPTVTRTLVPGIDVGPTIDVNLTPHLSLATELLYSTRTIRTHTEGGMNLAVDYTESLSFFSFPLLIKWRTDLGAWQPYIFAGYLGQARLGVSSDYSGRWTSDSGTTAETGSDPLFDDFSVRATEDRRRPFSHGVSLGLGTLRRIGDGALRVEIRYDHGVTQMVRTDLRYDDPDYLYRYLTIDNEYRLRSLSASLGYVFFLNPASYRK